MDGDENNLARQHEAAQREQAAVQAGMAGQDFAPRTAGERMAYQAANAPRAHDNGALGLLLVGIGALGLWPVCGAFGVAAAVGAGRGLKAVLPHDDPRWSLLWALGGLVAGLLGLALGFRLEEVLARSRVYRFVRHFVRLAWAGVVFTYGCVSARIGGTYEQWPDHLDWHWIDRKLTPGLWVVIALGIVATHFVSLRFDRAFEDAESPDDAADRQEDREDRARGMRMAFMILGAVGAVAAVVHGDKLGQIILAAVVFGVVGVVGYLLYRGVRGIFGGARRRRSR